MKIFSVTVWVGSEWEGSESQLGVFLTRPEADEALLRHWERMALLRDRWALVNAEHRKLMHCGVGPEYLAQMKRYLDLDRETRNAAERWMAYIHIPEEDYDIREVEVGVLEP